MTNTSDKPKDDELSEEALKNLTGFFDVLIQMDMAQKAKQQAEGDSPSDQSSKTDKKSKKKRGDK